MTTTLFLMLLTAFSIISSLVTEAIKKLVEDKLNLASNIIALSVALVVGGVGTIIYYQLNAIEFSLNNIICAVLMGLASGVASMVGFDKFIQTIKQCGFLKGDE